MTSIYCSILILVSAILLLLLLIPTVFDLLTKMPPKPKLNVHNFPRPPLLEKTPRHLQVKWRDQTVADTKDAYWVLETTHPPSMPSESKLRNLRKSPSLKSSSLLHSPNCLYHPSPSLPPYLLLRMERARYILEPPIPQGRKRGHKEQSMEL